MVVDNGREPSRGRAASPPGVLVLLPEALRHQLFSDEALDAVAAVADVTLNRTDRNWSADELTAAMPDVDVLVTGWGSPRLTDSILDAAPRLRLIAHSAGSIKALIPRSALERGIEVTTAAVAIAPAVAELSLLLILLGLRHVHRYDRGMRDGGRWQGPWEYGAGRELRATRVGVVGAGFVGRESVGLLRPLAKEVWVADPYLAADDARAMGVTVVPLERLLAECPVVTVHAPTTPETRHMIGRAELARLADGALLVNTARSWVVDQAALLGELQAGRIAAALDVFDEEPLAADSPFRTLDNVILTPHVAGATAEARRRQGDVIAAEIRRHCAGEPLRHGVRLDQLEIMA